MKDDPEVEKVEEIVPAAATGTHDDDLLDEALEESFPASDPPSTFRPS